MGKSPNHMPADNTCETCHRPTSGWTPATWSHTGIVDNCYTCHNGTIATGESTVTFRRTAYHRTCHTPNGWVPASFDHAGIVNSCFTCHNGTSATGKGTNHIPTGNTCETCHNTTAFSPASMNHAGITSGCFSCHNGSLATGKIEPHPDEQHLRELPHDERVRAGDDEPRRHLPELLHLPQRQPRHGQDPEPSTRAEYLRGLCPSTQRWSPRRPSTTRASSTTA
ncbi:MAG: cytochrome c3 family protein [Myxococcota bacterium]